MRILLFLLPPHRTVYLNRWHIKSGFYLNDRDNPESQPHCPYYDDHHGNHASEPQRENLKVTGSRLASLYDSQGRRFPVSGARPAVWQMERTDHALREYVRRCGYPRQYGSRSFRQLGTF